MAEPPTPAPNTAPPTGSTTAPATPLPVAAAARRMKTDAMARKVKWAAAATGLVGAFVWYYNRHVDPDIPFEISGALTTIVTAIVGYMVPPNPADQVETFVSVSELQHTGTPPQHQGGVGRVEN